MMASFLFDFGLPLGADRESEDDDASSECSLFHVMIAASLSPSPRVQYQAFFPPYGGGPRNDSQTTGSRDGGGSGRGQQHTGGPSRLMSALGLRDHAVRNVIMHRDIVPRAFACDYSPVADILKGWGPGFRDHFALSVDGRKHLCVWFGRNSCCTGTHAFLSLQEGVHGSAQVYPSPALSDE